MTLAHPTIPLTRRKHLGKLISAVPEGQVAYCWPPALPPRCVAYLFLWVKQACYFEKGILLWPYHIQLCPARHRENDSISEIWNGITEQIIIDVSSFYNVNELCGLSTLAPRVLCNYCILPCFCNCQLAPWRGGNLHSVLTANLFLANNTLDVRGPGHSYSIFIFSKEGILDTTSTNYLKTIRTWNMLTFTLLRVCVCVYVCLQA